LKVTETPARANAAGLQREKAVLPSRCFLDDFLPPAAKALGEKGRLANGVNLQAKVTGRVMAA